MNKQTKTKLIPSILQNWNYNALTLEGWINSPTTPTVVQKWVSHTNAIGNTFDVLNENKLGNAESILGSKGLHMPLSLNQTLTCQYHLAINVPKL